MMFLPSDALRADHPEFYNLIVYTNRALERYRMWAQLMSCSSILCFMSLLASLLHRYLVWGILLAAGMGFLGFARVRCNYWGKECDRYCREIRGWRPVQNTLTIRTKP